MYGTVARMRLKPGVEAQMKEQLTRFEALDVPGFVTTYIYRMDADPDEIYMAVVFKDREAYFANANSPEQHSRYEQMRALLAADPEWHDGEIVYAGQATPTPTG